MCLSKVNNNLYRINEENNTIQLSNKTIRLKKNLMKDKNVYYMSFIDFCNMLNLHTRWDKESKIIKCNSRLKNDTSSNMMSENSNQEQQLEFIRFEDVCVTSMNYDKDYFENLRIIANYMSENYIPYHIAWIPRYVNVKVGIDNDPCNKNSFEIDELNVDGSLKRIKNEESSKMGSVFYHPRLEGSYIHLIEDQYGSPDYNYDEDSILKQLVNILEEKHYKISNVKKFGSTLTLKKPSPKGNGF